MEPEKKKKWYNQSFNSKWLNDSNFKVWLQQDINNPKASYCKFCKFTLKNANRSSLIKHQNSTKHKTNFENAVSIPEYVSIKTIPESEQIAKSELLIAGYFSEHNIPLVHAVHFDELCRRAFPDSQIASKLELNETKMSCVIQDGIAFHEKSALEEICRKQKFSILIDEASEESVTQILAVVVRYFDEDKLDVVDALLDTVVVENGTAESLYNAVKNIFKEKCIPLDNIIGFGCDDCSTMMGKSSGFQKLLINDVKSVFVIGCVCHSFALCASKAVSVLPSHLESFIRDITSYLSRSEQSQKDFYPIQEATVHHKVPKLAQTRWLSREKVISSILEYYDALVLFFQSERKTDNSSSKIYEVLMDCRTKPMLLFLQYMLQKINALNEEFQSEHFRLHELYLSVSMQYKIIISFFIREDIVNTTNLLEIDIQNKLLYKNIDDIYVGGRAMSHLIREPLKDDAATKSFKNDCLKVLIELASQIQKRFSFDENGVVSNLRLLNPKIVGDFDKSPSTIVPLAINFPSVVNNNQLNEFDDQWRSFKMYAAELTLDMENIPRYWYSLRELRDGSNKSKYSLLSNFMTTLTVLPQSSATVERIFSEVNCIKTKLTSLKMETVRDQLLAKQCVTKNYSNCIIWEPPKKLIEELEEGTLYQRYEKRIKYQEEKNEAFLYDTETDEEEEVDN